MPRTRTKYIWPPPMLADDNNATSASTPTISNAATNEPRAKKPRLESASTARKSTASGRNTPARQNQEPSQGQAEGKADYWDPDSGVAPPSQEAIFAAYARIPMHTQIKRYREWRRFGSVHDDYCMKCRKAGPKTLVPCNTCSKCFHDECTPPGSLYNERRQWFCALCVHRNWHEQPPTLTPPASPSPEPANNAIDQRSSENNTDQRNNRNMADQQGNVPSTGNSQALSILAEISRSMSRGETRHTPNLPPQPHRFSDVSSPYSPNPSSITLPSISTRPHEFGLPPPPAPSPSAYGGNSILDSHARKSKFATLSSEVDSALWVLYRELESVTSLRQQIGELESEIVKLRQDVSIRDNQLILSRRSMSSAHNNTNTGMPGGISQAEIDRLRVQAAKVEELTRQAESMRAKNEALEKELKDAKAESAAKDEMLNEWKGRLVSLIGD
uniref:PHD finger protein 21A n=1 Tax=Talaromyces marneffei PM1 TaxID=1077442 RepID=A0A093VHM5_TALMA